MKFIVFNGTQEDCSGAAKALGGKTVSLHDCIIENLYQVLGLSPGEFPKDGGFQLQASHIRKMFGMLEETVAVGNYAGKTVHSPAEAIAYFAQIGAKELFEGWLANRFAARADDGVYVVLDATPGDLLNLAKRGEVADVLVSDKKPEGHSGLWVRSAKDGLVSEKDAATLAKKLKKLFYEN